MKIAVTGKMRSGKDTLANYFIENDNAKKIAFGDGIKRITQDYFPNVVAKGKPRRFYQGIGQYFRHLYPNVWIEDLDRTLVSLQDDGIENFVISDVRQMNEYKYLKEKGFTVIKVQADDFLRKERVIKSGDVYDPEDFFHETEIAVDGIPYDFIVYNNTSIRDFNDQIEKLYANLKGDKEK